MIESLHKMWIIDIDEITRPNSFENGKTNTVNFE